jgi:hypothetical protein
MWRSLSLSFVTMMLGDSDAIMSRSGVAVKGGLGADLLGACGVRRVEVFEDCLFLPTDCGLGGESDWVEIEGDEAAGELEGKKGTRVRTGVQLSEFLPGLKS